MAASDLWLLFGRGCGLECEPRSKTLSPLLFGGGERVDLVLLQVDWQQSRVGRLVSFLLGTGSFDTLSRLQQSCPLVLEH